MKPTCLSCGRCFETQRGLSQHVRLAHRDLYDQANQPAKRTRVAWDHEFMHIVAKSEVDLVRKGIRCINEQLCQTHGITLDRCKGVRRKAEYRAMVASILAEETNVTSAHTESDEEDRVTSNGSATLEKLYVATQSGAAQLHLSDDDLAQIVSICRLGVDCKSPEDELFVQETADNEYLLWRSPIDVGGKTASGQRRTSSRSKSRRRGNPSRSSKKERSSQYARVQQMYVKNRSECADEVLSGDWAKARVPLDDGVRESFWRGVMEEPSAPDQ